MMAKIAIINKCSECPHYSDDGFAYGASCYKLNKTIIYEDGTYCHDIFEGVPSWCPLEDALGTEINLKMGTLLEYRPPSFAEGGDE